GSRANCQGGANVAREGELPLGRGGAFRHNRRGPSEPAAGPCALRTVDSPSPKGKIDVVPSLSPGGARAPRANGSPHAAIAWAALLALALLPAASTASMGPIDGIGLIDYSSPPDFRVGTWAKYHIVGHSQMGLEDDYFVTVIIAGEEEFWGERCFWVETHTD